MDFIQIGHRPVAVSDVADFLDGRNVAIHGIDGLERHQLGAIRIELTQSAVQVFGVIVLEALAFCAAVAHALDHRGMVVGVRKNRAIGQARGQGAERRPVRHIARGKEQGGLLAVQVGQFTLQQHVMMVGPGDIARSAGAGAALVQRVMHGRQHIRMLAHAQIIVGAPDSHVVLMIAVMAARSGELARAAFQVCKYPIATFLAQGFQFLGKECLVIHV